jgi:hypothetical protein
MAALTPWRPYREMDRMSRLFDRWNRIAISFRRSPEDI